MVKPLLLRHKPDGSKAALRSMTIFHTVNTSFFFFFLEAGGGATTKPVRYILSISNILLWPTSNLHHGETGSE